MKCLDHIDMVVITGAVATVASAVFLFAYPGIVGEPLTPGEPMSPSGFLQEELERTIEKTAVTPGIVSRDRDSAQAALGAAIRDVTIAKNRSTAFSERLMERAQTRATARHEFLEGVFKLPSDWSGKEFTAMERRAEMMAQPELGLQIVAGTQSLERAIGSAEAAYGRALLAATQATDRASGEPFKSAQTIMSASTALTDMAQRSSPAPSPTVDRDPAWGFGSIGDGVFLPLILFGAGAVALFAVGIGMTEGGATTRTVTVYCDRHHKDILVEMLVSDEMPYEVLRCSGLDGEPVICDKQCLTWPVAHAA